MILLAIPAGFEPATLCLEGKSVASVFNQLDLQTLSKPLRKAHGFSSAYRGTYKLIGMRIMRPAKDGALGHRAGASKRAAFAEPRGCRHAESPIPTLPRPRKPLPPLRPGLAIPLQQRATLQ